MNRVKSILFWLVLIAVFAMGACETGPTTEERLTEALDAITIESETDDAIDLPDEVKGFPIIWTTDDEDVISATGEVNRPFYDEGDAEVVLTATIEYDDVVKEADYPVTVFALPEKETYHIYLDGALESIDVPDTLDASIDLPDEVDDFEIAWTSSDETYLKPTGELVRRPTFAEGDQNVELVAAAEAEGYARTRSIDVSIPSLNVDETLEYIENIFEEKAWLNEPLQDDLPLPEEMYGVTITWTSDQPDVLSADGSLTRPLFHEEDETVVLSAELSVADASHTVDFTLSAPTYSLEDSAGLMIDEAIATIDWVTSPIEASSIEFPSAIDDVIFEEWHSEDESYIHQSGLVNPPLHQTGEKEVLLTTTVTFTQEPYDDTVFEHDITVVVAPREEGAVDSFNILPFENLAEEWALDDGDLRIYYLEAGGTPYVDMRAFLELLDGGEEEGAIHYDELDVSFVGNRVIIESHFEDEDGLYDEMTYSLEIDFADNTAIVNNYSFFNSFHVSPKTDFGLGLEVVGYEYELSDPVVFDFEAYRMELVRDRYLIPFHVANLFFSGSMFDLYYNGDAIYGFDTYQRHDEDVRSTMLSSSYNHESIPREKRLATYNFLVFSFDYFYGLKADHAVDTYYDVFDMEEALRDSRRHYENIRRMALRLDDLHTSFLTTGMYYPDYEPQLGFNELGPRSQSFYEILWDIQDYRLVDRRQLDDPLILDEDSVVLYDDGRVARIPISGFDEETGEKFAEVLDYVDSLETVEEIIIDLSYNTGGIVGGMIQVLGHMTDEDIPLHNLNAGDLSTSTTYYAGETEARDYEWHILASPITYSAGNMMVQIAKDMGLATIIGQNTAGGAASITTNILPSGAIIIMSSPRLSADADYESIETGVEVDIEIPLTSFRREGDILDALDIIDED